MLRIRPAPERSMPSRDSRKQSYKTTLSFVSFRIIKLGFWIDQALTSIQSAYHTSNAVRLLSISRPRREG